MRGLVALFLTLLALAAPPLAAQTIVYQEVVEEIVAVPATGSERFVGAAPAALHRRLWSVPGARCRTGGAG
jgi:hypothetical protein